MKKKKKPTKVEIQRKERKLAKREYIKKLAEWKVAVKERDNYFCQICQVGLKDKPHNCHAHHILDKKNFREHALDINNGITLCYPCHKVGPKSPHMNAVFFSEWLKINKFKQYLYILNLIRKHSELMKYCLP